MLLAVRVDSRPSPRNSRHMPDPTPETHALQLDPKMLSVLVCPKTRGPLVFDSENNELISKKAGLAYPIREGVPILLIERARAL